MLRHFPLKYVSIPAKKCLAQRKNSSLPVTLGVFRYTLGVQLHFTIDRKKVLFRAAKNCAGKEKIMLDKRVLYGYNNSRDGQLAQLV